MKNRYFIIGGISSAVIYISLIIAIIIYIQKPSKKYISNPQKNNSMVVSLTSPLPIKKVTHKKRVKKKIIKKKKKLKKRKTIKKKKIIKKKIVKKPIIKKKKIIKKIEKKKEISSSDLFKSIQTKKPKKRKNFIQTTDKPKSSKSDLKNKMNAYGNKVRDILYDGFPEQERFAGNQIDIILIIYPSGRFNFKITKYSSNTEFNEEIIMYLEQLQNIGFDRHNNSKAYRFNIEFIAKE